MKVKLKQDIRSVSKGTEFYCNTNNSVSGDHLPSDILSEIQDLVNIIGIESEEYFQILEGGDIPSIQSNIDWSPIIKLAEELKKEVIDGTYHEDNDYAHYFEETVLTTLYGDDFYTWFNKNT